MHEKKIECIMDNKKPTRIVVLGNAGVGKTGKKKKYFPVSFFATTSADCRTQHLPRASD